MKISVNIKPNSKHREGVVVDGDGNYVVYVKEPPIEGRSNANAIKLLAAHFNVSKSQVKLIRGHKSKLKTFTIELNT